ncbi:MAG: TonB-dependent receptor [Flavobacterium psychrophilum]|jgi:Fe(3+) dicitrate transport protein|nr:MAG: TonB-dependent receptor [Flavobacterium psychrophilum]
MKAKPILLFTILYVSLLQSLAQSDRSVEGSITDINNQPLAGVNVFIDETGRGDVSNAKGFFKLHGLAPGKYVLKLSSIGFITLSQPIDLTVEETVKLTLALKESLYELPEIVVSRETLTGGSKYLPDIPGSAHYLSLKVLNEFNYSDVNRILRNVPGVNLQEEDGFGLRPNIGMRGTGVERSSKITLMEDGVLAAPAPYSSPAAYYFPTVGRMQGIEVRKGSSQIKYGPYTTGGAINFISTQIPSDFSARVNLLGGNFGRRIAQASIGQSFEYGGFVLETYQQTATGFKELDNGGPTGFTNEDYLAKFRINSPSAAKVYQALTFKIGQATSDADETYLGLTQEDFDSTPYRRYASSQLDNITTKHSQYSVKYNIIPTRFMDVSVTTYRNEFSRNWYKLDAVKYGTNAKVSIANLLDDPSTYSDEYSIVTGQTSPNTDAFYVKANNRSYYSRGIQMATGFNFKTAEIDHDIEIAFRYHQDEEDRYQWQDTYAMENGVMKLTTAGTPGTESNRISTAKASAAYLQYNLTYGKFSALPGVRFESIELTQLDYKTADPQRTGANLTTKDNRVGVWIPGLGINYSVTKSLNTFAGIHKGFAPPGFDKDDKPEESINYEFGARLVTSRLNTQAVFFYNNYSNLLGSDLAASGGGGTGDLFNAGKATVAGTELEIQYTFITGSKSIGVPVSLAYTYTDGKFGSSFDPDTEDWNNVVKGDQIPYLAANQLTLNAGMQHRLFDINVSSKYVGVMRTTPGQGEIPPSEKLNGNFIVDLSTNIRLNKFLTAYGSISNITNEVYAVARRPAGLRPGMPRSFTIGIKALL